MVEVEVSLLLNQQMPANTLHTPTIWGFFADSHSDLCYFLWDALSYPSLSDPFQELSSSCLVFFWTNTSLRWVKAYLKYICINTLTYTVLLKIHVFREKQLILFDPVFNFGQCYHLRVKWPLFFTWAFFFSFFFLFFFFNFCFFGHTCSIQKFLGQGLNLSHSCGNAGSLTTGNASHNFLVSTSSLEGRFQASKKQK